MFLPLLFLAATAAAPVPTPASTPVLSGTTTRSMAQFGQCFAAIERAGARPYWFVAVEDGGRFSNAAAPGVLAPYSIRFTQGAATNRVQLSVAGAIPNASMAVAKSVQSCW